MKKFVVRLLCFFGVIFLILSFGLTALIWRTLQPKLAEVTPNTVLELKLTSALHDMPSASMFPLQRPSVSSLRDIIDTLKTSGQDTHIKGLILHLEEAEFNGLAQIQEFRNAIHTFRKKGKFAIAYNDSFGEVSSGMGTYYLAAACDEIWIQPLGILNIAGLSTLQPFGRKLLDAIGILPEIEIRDEYKTAYDGVREPAMTPANREATQAMLNSLFKQMTTDIAKDREITEAAVLEAVNRAPIYILEDALKEGLIDKVTHKDELYQYLETTVGKDVNFVELEKYPLQNKIRKAMKADVKIAVVFAQGVMISQAQNSPSLVSSAGMDIEGIGVTLSESMKDDAVKAIILRIDSSGGSPLAAEALWHKMEQIRKDGKKPLIVSMGDVAASGGYWFATPANKIVANPGTLTGSIGVILSKVASEKFWEKIGVHWDIVQTAPNAAMWNMIYPHTPEEKKAVSGMIDYIYQVFMQKVSEGRHLDIEHVRQVAKGRVWTGEQALQWGLVDVLGDLNAAIELAKNEAKLSLDQRDSLQIIYLPKPKYWFERFSHFLTGEMAFSEAMAPLFNGLWGVLKIGFLKEAAVQHQQALSSTVPKVVY